MKLQQARLSLYIIRPRFCRIQFSENLWALPRNETTTKIIAQSENIL